MDLRQRLAHLAADRAGLTAPSSAGTADRLKRLLDRAPGTGRRLDERAVADHLGGAVLASGVVLIEQDLALSHAHGRIALSGVLEAPVGDLVGGDTPADRLLFLDTETTGLAGGTGTLAFLLGLARVAADRLHIRQYFLTGFGGEQAMLEHARDWFVSSGQLVTFNGKSFDVPLLATRHRLRRLAWPLADKPHLDLLHPTRAAFVTRWPDCRLQRAEAELLGMVRQDDLPGWLVPQVWGDFVRDGALGQVPSILEHNRLDVVSLLALLIEIARVYATPGYAGADTHALARRHLRAGAQDRAIEHLDHRREQLAIQGALELARLFRRQGRWDDAVAIWRPLMEQGIAEACLALAKYHEHVGRDYERAVAACQRLIALQPAEPEHGRRLARLHRKLAEGGGLLGERFG